MIAFLTSIVTSTNITVRLFATNDLVDDFNFDEILDFPGPLHEYLSIDTGEKKCLSEMMACRMLWLKIGIPIILIKNLPDQLVNGLRGSVYDILGDSKVFVEFPKMKEIIYIEKVRFEGNYMYILFSMNSLFSNSIYIYTCK